MRTAILLALLSLISLSSFAQTPVYNLDTSIKKLYTADATNLVTDVEDNLYGLNGNKVYKMKDGVIKLEFEVNKEEYSNSYVDAPVGILVDGELNIYLVNGAKGQIAKHDSTGKLLNVFSLIGSDSNITRDIFFNSKFEINVFDSSKRKLYLYSKVGSFLRSIQIPEVEPGYVTANTDITIDKADNIYISEEKRDYENQVYFGVLQILDKEGNLIRKFGRENKDVGSAIISGGNLAVDGNGKIYFSNATPNIHVLSPSAELVAQIYVPHIDELSWRSRTYLALDSENNLFVGGGGAKPQGILKYDANHQLIDQWGRIKHTYDIAFDKNDNLYFIDPFSFEIIKTDNQGNQKTDFNGTNSKLVKPVAITVDDEGYVYVLDKTSEIKKYDPTGKLIAIFANIYFQWNFIYSAGLEVDSNGNLYVTINSTSTINKYDKNGKYVTQISHKGTDPGLLSFPLDVAIDALGNLYVLDDGGNRVQKFSNSGKFLFGYSTVVSSGTTNFSQASISSDRLGNVVVSSGPKGKEIARIFDMKGKLVSILPHSAQSIAFNRNGKLLATSDNADLINIYSTQASRNYNIIQGNIYHDKNADCINEAEGSGLADILVKAEPGPYFGITDVNGNYSIIVEEDTYKVTPMIENKIGKELNTVCYSGPNKEGITFKDYGNFSTGNGIGVDFTLSPYLTTSVSSTRRRRCFESTTKVTYSNTGFAAAENAKVHLLLPKEVELLSADKIFTRLADGTYVFEVGTLAAGQIGTITIQDRVVCGDESIRGLTVCTKAWISTGSLPTCPVVTTTAKCNAATGEVRVVIKNTGTEAMPTSELFRIYLNGQLTTVESYKLAAGDSLVLWIPAGGKTVRLEATQPDCNSENTLASVTIEGCKVSTDPAPISTGFVNALPPDEEEPEVAEECLLITDSYDPNDKQVTPTGLTQENYTPTNTALTYKIRFQNTGTDVAYRVVVTDTLSEHLDISTLQLGAASHNYRYEVSGKGRPVLTWTFDNIMLPDSTSNEPGSHGYIQFSIKPKAVLPEKTAVENFADIFFDFNSPVRTNTTINRIYDMPDEVKETDRLDAAKLIATPMLENFFPASGKFGTEVILTGKRFSAIVANNKVWFNGVQATIVEASENELKVRVPTNATSGNIKIQTLDGAAHSTTGFEVYQPPVVSSFAPAEGIAGTTVTLQGKYLTEAWLQGIKLGTIACQIVRISDTEVVVKVPGGANTDVFEITSKGGQVQSAGKFRVWHQPAISSLSTVLDKVGATITITGTNFAPEAARNIVKFGTVQATVLQASATTLKVKVPAGATTGIVTLETPGGTAKSPAIFEVIPAPQVYTFTPPAGSVGTEVKLTGAHFLTLGKQDTITFNGQQAIVLEATPEQATVRVPRGATSGNITVAGIGGQAITASAFKVEELSPDQAIEVYPNPTNGNFTIRFAHADFEIKEVKLFSALGSLVYTEKVSSPRPEHLDIKLTSPKPGIYILHTKTERGLVIKKLHIL